ncbi:MAG TPA: sigma-70 family RNA polymerase sigma factor [Opitutaceae bacterium]|nr:sigma-70 family RNA polymerase sigma factor [Opitutaceae bacterium]
MVEDRELLWRYARGHDEAAFRALVDRHVDFVFAAARRRLNGDAAAAEDVAQQVFTAVATQAQALSAGVALPAWLYLTTRNICVDFVRAQTARRRRELEAAAMHEPSSGIDPEKLRPLLDGAIDELPEKDRSAVVLRFFGHQSFVQVGSALRVSEDAARMRVDRALGKLQLLLARRGITSTAAALGIALTTEAIAAAPRGVAARIFVGALSSAGTGAATTGTLGFMAAIKTWVAGAALVAALGTVSFQTAQWRLAIRARDLARVNAAAAAQRAQLADLQAQKADATLTALQRQEPTPASAVSRRVAQTATSAPHGLAGGDAKWNPFAEGTAFMVRHPEVKQALLDYDRARSRFSYGPLFDSLGLTPDQRAKLELYLTRGQGMGAPIPGAASDQRQLTLSLSGAADTPDNTWLKQTLGADALRQIADYANQKEARDWAVRVAGGLWDTDTPMTPAQGAELANTITAHRTLVNHTWKIDWAGVATDAASYLSAPQLTAIEAVRINDQFDQILNRPTASTTVVGATHP